MESSLTPNLKLRYILSNQSQKEIVINNNFRILDGLFANNAQNNASTVPANRLHVVVSDAGNILYNASSVKFTVTRSAVGQYVVTAGDGEQFSHNAHLICTAYAQNQQQIPYICNIIFASTTSINISIYHLDANRVAVAMDGSFTLLCG